jgi:hypothetical protein
MPTLQAFQPYVEQLFEDSDVQKQLSRAAANFRGAGARAGSAKSKRKAFQDPKLRQRLLDGARAGVAAGVAIMHGPEKQKQKRRGRGKWLLVLAGLGAGAYVATNESARTQLRQLLGHAKTDPESAK